MKDTFKQQDDSLSRCRPATYQSEKTRVLTLSLPFLLVWTNLKSVLCFTSRSTYIQSRMPVHHYKELNARYSVHKMVDKKPSGEFGKV